MKTCHDCKFMWKCAAYNATMQYSEELNKYLLNPPNLYRIIAEACEDFTKIEKTEDVEEN